MSDDALVISFPGCSVRDGNVYAASLAEAIRDADPQVGVERRRERPDTQDFGATLLLILGSASASAIASGIASWIARHSGARIEISTKAGTVVASNLDSRDAARIAAALSRK